MPIATDIPNSRPQRERALNSWIMPLLIFVACVLLYSININDLPHPDELHHILAAKGLIATGEPRIAEGVYNRVYLYTWLVAQSFKIFGEGLGSARIPALIPMAMCVVLVFVWVRWTAGTLAAWSTVLLFGLSPFAVGIAQFSRFYALQVLVFTAAAILVFCAVTGRSSLLWRLAIAATATLLLLLATYLQPTTLFGCVGLGLWVAGSLALPWLGSSVVRRRSKIIAGTVVAAMALLLLLILYDVGIIGQMYERYRWSPLFMRDRADQFWYYHERFVLFYPTLWPAVGVLSLTAIYAHPSLGAFSSTVFCVGFLLNSFAASKGMRYLAYAQPLLFVLWGVSLAALWPRLAKFALGLQHTLAGLLVPFGRSANRLAWALVAGGFALLVAANPAWLRTVAALADITIPPEEPGANWPLAKEDLMPWVESADVVVATEELGALYFLGRFDVRFSPSKLEELAPQEQHEFGIDYRTGRPVIGRRESLELIFRCYRSGIILGPAVHWGSPHLVDKETLKLIEVYTKPLSLPRGSRIEARVWQNPIGSENLPACADLPKLHVPG